MAKTKFSIDYKAHGSLNEGFTRMVTNHNEGKTVIGIEAFEWYAKIKTFEWPTIYTSWHIESHPSNPHYIEVYENEKLTVSIMEKEIVELIQTPENEYPEVL